MNCFDHALTETEEAPIALVLLVNASLPDSIYKNLLAIIVNKADDTTLDTDFTGIVSLSEQKLALESVKV